ncbi:MAG TPA: hypothetical protein VK203_23090 [Nostocaceae cyanobacterium]|nr:hypothetical protein [Nostocaceae cyanobacterium]
MREKISELIKNSYSEAEASTYLKYNLTQKDIEIVKESARNVLKDFPVVPNCCAPMSAMWTAMIRDNTNIPVYMVAGSLDMNEKRIFGGNDMRNINEAFSKSNLDWDGHCWMVFGDYVGDISLFRTVYSQQSPEWLKNMILTQFGEGRGILLGNPSGMLEHGLVYTPLYVLKDSEITGLVKSIPLLGN